MFFRFFISIIFFLCTANTYLFSMGSNLKDYVDIYDYSKVYRVIEEECFDKSVIWSIQHIIINELLENLKKLQNNEVLKFDSKQNLGSLFLTFLLVSHPEYGVAIDFEGFSFNLISNNLEKFCDDDFLEKEIYNKFEVLDVLNIKINKISFYHYFLQKTMHKLCKIQRHKCIKKNLILIFLDFLVLMDFKTGRPRSNVNEIEIGLKKI